MRTVVKFAALAAIAASAVAASGCGAAPSKPHPAPVALTASEISRLRAYGSGDTAFGLNVLSALCRANPGGNVVISPVSLETGLGMAYLGARGATAAAMAQALRQSGSTLSGPGQAVRSLLLRSLNRPGVDFAVSNRIWADPSLRTNPGFVAALRAADQSGITHVPLLSDPEHARAIINAAIAAGTHGHIPSLLAPGTLGQVGWVLTDALYLDARWKHPFNHALTATGPFRAVNGQVTAHYLNGEGFRVAQAGGWTAADLPYRGGRLSMVALLPPATAGASGSARGGCPLPGTGTLNTITAGLAAGGRVMAISVPKVKLATSASLQDVLTALGMGIAFTDRADFTRLSPQACCIGFVQHAATLDMAEKGTVASAATAVGIQPSAGFITLRFNRPYLLLLRDSLTGEPLFMAWVANPAGN